MHNPIGFVDPFGLSTCEAIKKEISEMTAKKAAATDRWLKTSNHKLAQAYRDFASSNPNFASLIRGRIIDRRMHNWMTNKYKNIPGAVFDKTIAGSGKLRPDAYFPDLDGKSVIFDIGGKSKIADIEKYQGMADILIPILH